VIIYGKQLLKYTNILKYSCAGTTLFQKKIYGDFIIKKTSVQAELMLKKIVVNT